MSGRIKVRLTAEQLASLRVGKQLQRALEDARHVDEPQAAPYSPRTETEPWDDWTRSTGGGLLILLACPVLVVLVALWFVARALGLGTS